LAVVEHDGFPRLIEELISVAVFELVDAIQDWIGAEENVGIQRLAGEQRCGET
jgi:hypothetical protein